MGLWNYCEVCGERIETGQPCIGVKEESENLAGSSICMNCAKIENLPDSRNPVSITDLLARAEAAEAAQETLQRAMAEYKERAEKAEQRVKKLDEAMEWAKYASGAWERAYYNAMARAGKAEREAEEERQEATLCRNGWKKAEKELAVAVNGLETGMAYGTGNLDTCIFCKNAQCYARGGTKPCLPKWRGTEEE